MKSSKLFLLLIIIPVLAGIIIATAYYNSANNPVHEGLPSDSQQSTTISTPLAQLQILSPKNKTYDKKTLYLNVTSSNSTAEIEYSLDGERNWTISKKPTIWADDGLHSITFYALDNTSKLIEYRTVSFEIRSPKFEQQPLTRAEAINYFTSQGFTIQKGSNVTVEQYYEREPPILQDFLYIGLSHLASHARMYNTTIIYEYVYHTEKHHYDLMWTIFYVEQPQTHLMLYGMTYDGPKWINGP